MLLLSAASAAAAFHPGNSCICVKQSVYFCHGSFDRNANIGIEKSNFTLLGLFSESICLCNLQAEGDAEVGTRLHNANWALQLPAM